MMRVKKGDTVVVIAGKDKGKKGLVLNVDAKNDKVLVEGINIVTKHNKPSATNPQGGITTKEAPIHISNVMPFDPETGKTERKSEYLLRAVKNYKKYNRKEGT